MPKTKNKVRISGKKVFVEHDILETIRFTHAINPLGFERAFRQIGIKISNQDDLITLAQLQASGQDKKGFKGPDGRIYSFDTEKIIRSIPVSKALVLSAPIDFYDMVVDGTRIKII